VGLVTRHLKLSYLQSVEFSLQNNFVEEKWLLDIELDGEWEECAFETRHGALSALSALARDYSKRLRRAILVSPRIDKALAEMEPPPASADIV
jgi:hypothetical protein